MVWITTLRLSDKFCRKIRLQKSVITRSKYLEESPCACVESVSVALQCGEQNPAEFQFK